MGGQKEPHHDRPRRSRFGEWLTTGRIAAGLRQSDLAARLGVTSGRVSEWEQGTRTPPPELLPRLRELLGPDTPPPPPPRRILGELKETEFRLTRFTQERDEEESAAA